MLLPENTGTITLVPNSNFVIPKSLQPNIAVVSNSQSLENQVTEIKDFLKITNIRI